MAHLWQPNVPCQFYGGPLLVCVPPHAGLLANPLAFEAHAMTLLFVSQLTPIHSPLKTLPIPTHLPLSERLGCVPMQPGYNLRLRYRSVPNSNHSYSSEVLNDCLQALTQYDLARRTSVGVEVRALQKSMDWWRLLCLVQDYQRRMTCVWAILCTNRRLGQPRDFPVQDEAVFGGQVRRGLSGDACNLHYDGRKVVILGHGPYATGTQVTTRATLSPTLTRDRDVR